MKNSIRPLRYVYETKPIDDWAGWTRLAKIISGEITYFDFGVKYEEYNQIFDHELYSASSYLSLNDIKEFASTFLKRLQVGKEFTQENIADFEDERNERWWLFYAGIPKDGMYTNHLMLAYKIKINGTTYIGSPFKLDWIEEILGNPPWEIESEEEEIRKVMLQGDLSTFNDVRQNVIKLNEILNYGDISKPENYEYIGMLHKLSEIEDLFLENGIDIEIEPRWQELYFRMFDNEPYEKSEIDDLKIYVKKLVMDIEDLYIQLNTHSIF